MSSMGKKKAWIAAAALILGAIVWYAISSNRVSLLEARVAKLEQAESATAALISALDGRNMTIADLGAACVSMATKIEKNERTISGGLSILKAEAEAEPESGVGGE